MAIVDFFTVKGFLGLTDDAGDGRLKLIHNGIEQAVKNYIDWEPEATTHTNKRYDGTGSRMLFLDELHVTAVARVANVRTDAIKIKNTATDASNAAVSIASTTLTLTVTGGSSASTTNFSLSTYSTMSTLITAINAYGNNWSAAIYDSNFNSYPSTNLMQVENAFTGSWDGVAADWFYLDMADKPIYPVRLYQNRGIIESPAGFPYGYQNIAVSYTAGYSAALMPDDLKLAIMSLVKFSQQRTDENTTGIKSFDLGHYSVTYGTAQNGNTTYDIPDEIMAVLDRYRRLDV